MIRESINHLTDEALNDLLIGMGSSEAEYHLAECPLCRGRVEEFRSGLEEFDRATLAWSEARSNAMGRTGEMPRLSWMAHTLRSWALAAAVLLLLAFTAWRYSDRFRPNQQSAQVSNSEDSAAQIAEDNELLKAVNGAIHRDDELLRNEFQFLRKTERLNSRSE